MQLTEISEYVRATGEYFDSPPGSEREKKALSELLRSRTAVRGTMNNPALLEIVSKLVDTLYVIDRVGRVE